MVSERTDYLYACLQQSLVRAEHYRALVAARERQIRDSNDVSRRSRSGTDLDLTVFNDEYFRAHRADETYHRGWANTYAQLYRAEVMREVELANRLVAPGDST